jgi:hypothetical protein
MAVTGVTHFNRVSGKNGVYVGARGSEVRIDEKQGVVMFTFGTASAAEVQVGTVPITGTVVAAYGVLGTADINCTHTVNHGSAGAQIATVTSASPGVAAVALSLTLSAAANLAVTAGESLTCTRSTTTSTGISQITLVITKNDAA